jgi:serpin B
MCSVGGTIGKVIIITAGLGFGFAFMASAESVHTKSLVEGNTGFALELYGRLRTTPGNLFISPYSISTCLAMTYAGARGDTQEQMAKVLHLSKDQTEVHSAFGELQRELNEISKQGLELTIANALWAQQGHPFLQEFLGTAEKEYQAKLKQVDFQTESQAAAGDINGWVAQKTKDKIEQIVPEGSVNAQTRLLLVNAIYFKGLWAKPFEKKRTAEQPFHLADGGQVNVPLMQQSDRVRYVENGDFQTVELPYRSNELSMVVLLPKQTDGCAQLEQRLTPVLLANTLSQMRVDKVDLFLPRFKVASGFNLNSTLAGMGMSDAFGAKADFSGMDGVRDLYVSGVFHKAWGEVNEEGTEAAAATAVGVQMLAIRRTPVFRADHPFIFLIRDTRSGSILFLGRMMNPAN